MRKLNNIFVTHQKNSSTRKNVGPRLMSTNKPVWSSMSVSALRLHCCERRGANLQSRASIHRHMINQNNGISQKLMIFSYYLQSRNCFLTTELISVLKGHSRARLDTTRPYPTGPGPAAQGSEVSQIFNQLFYFLLYLFLTYFYRKCNFKTFLLKPFLG